MRTVLAIMLLAVSLSTHAQRVQPTTPTGEKVFAAMKSDIRTQADTDRDRNRRPVETLEFFGLTDDMNVIELLPGGGWYTKLLAPTLKDKGKLYLAIGAGRAAGLLSQHDSMSAAEVLEIGAEMTRTETNGIFGLDTFSFGVDDVDMVLTFRNQHNFNAQGRASINAAVFNALRPGGLYGVIDHTRRHMQAGNSENRRRLDPVLAIQEIQAAGFELVDFSDLHYRPDDELFYEVGRRTVTGNTDRWTLLFKKPE